MHRSELGDAGELFHNTLGKPIMPARDVSVVSHKYAYESAGPFGRRLRCSSSRGNGRTGGFEICPPSVRPAIQNP